MCILYLEYPNLNFMLNMIDLRDNCTQCLYSESYPNSDANIDLAVANQVMGPILFYTVYNKDARSTVTFTDSLKRCSLCPERSP